LNIDTNIDKTEEEYRKLGLTYDNPQLRILKDWRSSVSGSTGNFNQDPDKPDVKYPVKKPFHIKRNFNLEDGKEYLTTVEQWVGVDAQRNEVSITVNEWEKYLVPIVRNTVVPSQTNVHITTQERKVTDHKTKFTTPWSKKAFDDAYDRSNQLTVEMSAVEIGRGRKPESVFDSEKFTGPKFKDLLNINRDTSKDTDATRKKEGT
jgi:hypothetical protein